MAGGVLSVACYALMALEVCLVFWAIGQPISLWVGTIVETFTRSASVAGGAIPGNLGALEASNVAVVKALGLAGGGTLALFRRVRSLMLATLGLVFYPRDTVTAAPAAEATDAGARWSPPSRRWATGLGGVGLFIIAALDSSFLSFPQVNDVLIIVLSTKYPGADAVLRRHDHAGLAGRLLHALCGGPARRRGVHAQAAQGRPRRPRAAALPALRPARRGRAVAAAAADAVQGVRAAGRRRLGVARGASGWRSSSAAASATSARATWRCCTASTRSS